MEPQFFNLINTPCVYLLSEPSPRSEIISQTIFCEEVEILSMTADSNQPHWICVKTKDDCTGWVPNMTVNSITEPYAATHKISSLLASAFLQKNLNCMPHFSLAFGSKVKIIDDNDPLWSQIILPNKTKVYVLKCNLSPLKIFNNKNELIDLSKKFLNQPFVKGGKCSFGFDGPGFIQMLYKELGIDLPRYCENQFYDNRFINILPDELEPGDLIFFGKEEKIFCHVGMFLGLSKFIHIIFNLELKPWVRESSLDDFEWNGNDKATYPYRMGRQLKESILKENSFNR